MKYDKFITSNKQQQSLKFYFIQFKKKNNLKLKFV